MKKKAALDQAIWPGNGQVFQPPPAALGEESPRLPEVEENGYLSADRVAGLIGNVLAGDNEAYRPLVENYQRAVFSLAYRLLRKNSADAEDITQETFVRAYEYLGSLEDSRRFGPWLLQIARSLCLDRFRRQETEKRALKQRLEQLRLEGAPEKEAAASEGMESALFQLPPDEYQVLKMRYYDKCTYEDIAARMQITFSQVDHLMRKARSHLATKLHLEKGRERTL